MVKDLTDDVTRSVERCAAAEFMAGLAVQPGALVIEGEAGIGKTTFWLTTCEHAQERGFQVLSARAAAAETVLAYAALADLLVSVEPVTWTRLPEPQRRAIDRITLQATDDTATVDQRTIAAAFLSVIELLAEQRTVVLAIDDLQWLDPSSASAIAFAGRRLSGPVGMLTTVRTGKDENPAAWLQLPRPDAVKRIRLSPMKREALHHVVSQHLGRPIPRPTMVRIYEVSGGNPFYAIELARVVDVGMASADIRLPTTLSELVRARLEALHSDVHGVLLATACLSKPTVELLSAALEIEPNELDRLLEEAENAGILVLNDHEIRFSHPLLRNGVYMGATATRRRGMHRRLARAVVEPELQARHLALAATHAEPATLESLDAAAEIARIRGAPAAAAELIDLAIGLGGDTVQRQIQSAAHHFDAGNAAKARDMLRHAIGRATPAPLRAQALNLLAVMSHLEDSLLDGADQLGRALVDAGDDLGLRVPILVSLSWIQIRIGQLGASARSIEDAVADAKRLEQPQLLSQALAMRVVVHLLLGDGLDDRSLCRALELEERHATIPAALRPTFQKAMVLAWTGQLDAAHDQFVAVRQSCIERGNESELIFVSFHSVLNEIWRADFAHATLIAEDTVERAQLLGGALQLSAALTARALVAAYAGREDDARRDVRDAIGPISRSGSRLLTAWAIGALGFLEVSIGNDQAAITELEPLLGRVVSAPGTEIFIAAFLPDAVEALTQLGRASQAEALIETLERNGHRLDRSWMLAVGARGRAMSLASRGDLNAASAAAQRALNEHDRLPMPFERARTQLLLGQIQRRHRQKRIASSTLHEALDTFETLGTRLWADRARAELTRVAVGPRVAGQLSASEQCVAELSASGMTNREVAAALFISPKTVEANLVRIYRKLGIRTRAELGGRMTQISG